MKIIDLFSLAKGQKAPEYFEKEFSGSTRFIQIDDLRSDKNLKYCQDSAKLVHCEPADIIIAWDGANAGTIGYGLKGIIGSTLAKMTPKKTSIYSPYAGYFLKSKFKYLRDNCTGATIPHISRKSLEDLEIPLPPLAEQIHIAQVLDQADRLRQQDRQLLAHYDQLVQAVFVEMFGDISINTKEWKTKTLREISLKFNDGPFGSNLKSEHYAESGIRIIRLQNIGIGEYIGNDKAFIPESHYKKISKYTCFPGDIVIATMGEPNVRACIIPSFVGKAVNKADCVLCRPNQDVASPEYICWLLNSPRFMLLVQKHLHGQTRVRVSMGQLAQLHVPVPPIELQQKFSAIIKNIEAQKAATQQLQAQSEALFNSLLQQAFRGELTRPRPVAPAGAGQLALALG